MTGTKLRDKLRLRLQKGSESAMFAAIFVERNMEQSLMHLEQQALLSCSDNSSDNAKADLQIFKRFASDGISRGNQF